MKAHKNLIYALVAAAAVLILVLFLIFRDKRPAPQRLAAKKEVAAMPARSKIPPSQTKTDFAIIEANTCNTDADCVAVFPTCCGTANPPFYINRQYKEQFTEKYKEINHEQVCEVTLKCPISYFGMATKTKCDKNICVEAIPLADTMTHPVTPVLIEEAQKRKEALEEWNRNKAALAAKVREQRNMPKTFWGRTIYKLRKAMGMKPQTAAANDANAQAQAIMPKAKTGTKQFPAVVPAWHEQQKN